MDHRPYDSAFPTEELAKVKQRRKHPTGELQPVKQVIRGHDVINVYPWKKLELGDFFLAPIGQRSIQAMKMGFAKASARYDIETVVVETEYNGEKCLRVTCTVIGIARIKQLCRLYHQNKKYRTRPISRNTTSNGRGRSGGRKSEPSEGCRHPRKPVALKCR